MAFARCDDDVIVASFELTFYPDPSTCRPAVLRSLITDVWTWHADGWRLQVRHAGAPPDPGAGVASQFGMVPAPAPIWDVNGELSLVSTGGNTSTRTICAGGVAVHRSNRTTTRASVTFLTSEVDAVTHARSSAIDARHGIRFGERLELFGRGSYARDRFAGIEDRIATGAGLAYTAPLPRRHALTTEGSIGFAAERRLDETRLRFATATGALGYMWTIGSGTEIRDTVGLIADVQTAGNWRGTNTAALIVSLTWLLSLKASHAIEYRHAPVAGFGRTDMRSAVAFVLSFQRRPRVR